MVELELDVRQQRAQEHVRANGRQQVGVLAAEAQARAHGSVAFDERAVIDEHARAHVAADALADKRRELAQSVLHGVVVVAAPGVARNASTRASLRLSGAIRHTDDDQRAGLRQELARACGQVRAGDVEPRHVALVPAG